MTRYTQSRLLVVGLTGFSITLILNLFGLLFLKQAAAEFLSPKWSQVWCPNYIVWFVLTVIGSRTFFAKR